MQPISAAKKNTNQSPTRLFDMRVIACCLVMNSSFVTSAQKSVA